MSVGFKASNHGRPLVGKLDCTEWAILLKSLVPLAKREKDSLRACEILRNTQYFFEQEHTQRAQFSSCFKRYQTLTHLAYIKTRLLVP